MTAGLPPTPAEAASRAIDYLTQWRVNDLQSDTTAEIMAIATLHLGLAVVEELGDVHDTLERIADELDHVANAIAELRGS